MAKRAEKEELSDMSGCRYLRMRYSEREDVPGFLAKCEKGIKNTLRRGSVLARRLSTAAASGFPMKITIRKVERAADFRFHPLLLHSLLVYWYSVSLSCSCSVT